MHIAVEHAGGQRVFGSCSRTSTFNPSYNGSIGPGNDLTVASSSLKASSASEDPVYFLTVSAIEESARLKTRTPVLARFRRKTSEGSSGTSEPNIRQFLRKSSFGSRPPSPHHLPLLLRLTATQSNGRQGEEDILPFLVLFSPYSPF